MKECLITNKICPFNNRKCKVCYLDECKEVMRMLDIQERNIRKEQLERLRSNLPEQCEHCPHLEVIDLKNMKVKCFYRVKNKCLLKG